MNRLPLGAAMVATSATLAVSSILAQQPASGPSDTWSKVKAEGARGLAIARIKAAYADHKDIPGRYIRVRYDGHTLQLAGFVPDTNTAVAAEQIAREIAKPEAVKVFWTTYEARKTSESYRTYVGEQAEDALIKTRVLAALAAPDVTPQFRNAEIQHIDVFHGKVNLYLIADAPPIAFALDSHVLPIVGVKSLQCLVLQAF